MYESVLWNVLVGVAWVALALYACWFAGKAQEAQRLCKASHARELELLKDNNWLLGEREHLKATIEDYQDQLERASIRLQALQR